MINVLTRNRWVFGIRGVAAIAFGGLALVWPAPTLTVLTALFGAYALLDGAALLIADVRADPVDRRRAWAGGIIGDLGVVVGIVTFTWPGLTAMSLLYLVAFWATATGLFQVIAALDLRSEIDGERWMALGAAASIVFGVVLVAFPGAGLSSLVWLVGIWSVVFGLSSLRLAARLDRIDSLLPEPGNLAAT